MMVGRLREIRERMIVDDGRINMLVHTEIELHGGEMCEGDRVERSGGSWSANGVGHAWAKRENGSNFRIWPPFSPACSGGDCKGCKT